MELHQPSTRGQFPHRLVTSRRHQSCQLCYHSENSSRSQRNSLRSFDATAQSVTGAALVSRQTFSSMSSRHAGKIGESAKRPSSTFPMQINKNTADLICRCFVTRFSLQRLVICLFWVQESVAAGLRFAVMPTFAGSSYQFIFQPGRLLSRQERHSHEGSIVPS
jgi:hypothetical protein